MSASSGGPTARFGTSDDGHFFADSPIFAVEDSTFRTSNGLPSGFTGLTYVTIKVGTATESGYLLGNAELKDTARGTNNYYSGGDQMHNKFAIRDGTCVFTGSWNFTVSDTYGSDANRAAGVLSGHTNHAVEVRSAALADEYTGEFDEMWGSTTATPSITAANFHSRKLDNTTHSLTIGGRTVEVYFSPSEGAMDRVTEVIDDEADLSARFCIYAFSDQALTDALKLKWKNSLSESTGTLTGFDLQGVMESGYWNQYWSASMDMTARDGSPDQSTKWNNKADVLRRRRQPAPSQIHDRRRRQRERPDG